MFVTTKLMFKDNSSISPLQIKRPFIKVFSDIFSCQEKSKVKLKQVKKEIEANIANSTTPSQYDHHCKHHKKVVKEIRELSEKKTAIIFWLQLSALTESGILDLESLEQQLANFFEITTRGVQKKMDKLMKWKLANVRKVGKRKMLFLVSQNWAYNIASNYTTVKQLNGVDTHTKLKSEVNEKLLRQTLFEELMLWEENREGKRTDKSNIDTQDPSFLRNSPFVRIQMDDEIIRDRKLIIQSFADALIQKIQNEKLSRKLKKGKKEDYKNPNDKFRDGYVSKEKKASESSLDTCLSSKVLAKKLGYSSTMDGYKVRKQLQDSGRISIKEKKWKVETNIKYEEAKEKYDLMSKKDEVGFYYYHSKKDKTVYKVRPFDVNHNHFQKEAKGSTILDLFIANVSSFITPIYKMGIVEPLENFTHEKLYRIFKRDKRLMNECFKLFFESFRSGSLERNMFLQMSGCCYFSKEKQKI